ncbi:hypothetical protein ACFQI7_14385 [Paenibacillus allorhizosphaerae]|uniref:DUF3309 domain-containing protein n=1 Tax=Paenibacillus allorhizosphaerae TaxID=2849866 RepID=A0ABN7TDW6_9BACL|nr:hypothetical protein [Paenibacillus allorhizosphaerae]CAG7626503.1 hypothetical protein PAECIP111802_01257 [Paenibacillus allorhizosphaerae]
MTVYVPFVVVIALLVGVGWLFIRHTGSDRQRSGSSSLLRWTGYGLIAVAVLLIAFGIWQHVQWENHSRGH